LFGLDVITAAGVAIAAVAAAAVADVVDYTAVAAF
jgi:hypothetical protein